MDKEVIKGQAKNLEGRAQEALGDLLDDPGQKAKGQVKQAEGKLRESAGHLRDAAQAVVDGLKKRE